MITPDGDNEIIIQWNCWDDEVTFTDLLPAGVCAEFVSTINRPARATSIWLLTNVLAPAVSVLQFIPIHHITHQQLSATVVVLVVKLVVVVGQVELDESGCQDAFTPV